MRRRRTALRAEVLEDRTTPVLVTPEPAGVIGVTPGHRVEVRQSAGAVLNSVANADALFAGTIPSAFTAFDDGVAVINYSDFANSPPPQANFGADRDIRAIPGNAFPATDADNYAIRATGFIFFPTAGAWTLTVNSDDGFRLRVGLNNTVVAQSTGPKGASDVSGVADVPGAGLYRYELVYFERTLGSEVEFFASGPGQPTAALVGSPAGTLTVFQQAQTDADLSVTKTNGQTQVLPGDTVTYTIVVSNAGPAAVTGAAVADNFPAGLTNVSFTSAAVGGATGNTAAGSSNIADTVTMPAGSSITYTVTGTVDPAATGTLSNTATVTGPGGTTDIDPSNNSATDADPIVRPDLVVTKTNGVASVTPGDTVTYTIVVSNNGTLAAAGATVTDTIAATLTNVTYTSSSAGGATGNTTSGNGSISDTVDLPVGGSITYTMTGTVAAGATGTLDNTATATPAGGLSADANPTDNTATDSDAVIGPADLAVTSSATPDPVAAGENLTYTIVVTNNGPNAAQTAQLTDTMPAGTTFVSFTAPAGWTPNTPAVGGTGPVTASIPVLAAGATATFTLVVRVDPTVGSGVVLGNTAAITAATPDPVSTNNSDGETTTVTARADLSITKTDGQTSATPGSTVTYTIVVTNNGPSTATGATVADTFPASLTNVTFTSVAAGGATGNTSGSGNINNTVNLPPGSSITYTVTATISPTATGTLTNTATVTAPATVTDANTANNTATDTTTIGSPVDLGVTITDFPDPVPIGGTLTYTITLTNSGTNPAADVSLSNAIPTGTTFVSFTAPAGFAPSTPAVGGTGTATATAATLAAGASVTFTLVVRVNASVAAGTNITNTATATTTSPETDTANNTATATTRARTIPSQIVVGPAAGDQNVKVFDPVTGLIRFTMVPFGAAFRGEIRVASGDITGDGIPDIIMAAGAGGAPHVKVFDGATSRLISGPLASFFAFSSDFRGGVFVGAGDIDGDGRADIIVGAGAGAGPHVKVFSGATGAEIRSFFAYGLDFTAGVTVGAGDVDGDGRTDIITGTGAGAAPHVKVFSGVSLAEIRSFFAYGAGFLGGVNVAGGDLDGDGRADIITGAGAGAGPHVKLFDGRTGAETASFFAYAPTFLGGARVAVTDQGGDGRLDIVTGSAAAASHVKAFDGRTLAEQMSFFAFDAMLPGVFVG